MHTAQSHSTQGVGHRAGRSGRPGSQQMSLLLPTAAVRPPCLEGHAWAFGGGLPRREQSAASGQKQLLPGPAPLALLPPAAGWTWVWKGRGELTISSENVSDTGTDPRDHIMRQTPVCPARQWELPLALTGTMTSDLKFCFLLAFLRSVGSEQ